MPSVIVMSKAERVKIYNILQQFHLAQVSLNVTSSKVYENIFYHLEQQGIKIKFLALQNRSECSFQLTFCVEKSHVSVTKTVLSTLLLENEPFEINPEVGMVAIYGPHFAEIPGILDTMYHTLFSQGVTIFAISTTVSTSFFVIHSSQVSRATDILKETFEIPQGKI